MYLTIFLIILGLSLIGFGTFYVIRNKRYFWLPPAILGGIGLMMIGLSLIKGIKDDWLGTIFIIFGMIFIFASCLTSLTIFFMKYQSQRKS